GTGKGKGGGGWEAMGGYKGKVFCCFHKRYSAFNALARKDLQMQLGEPISYHCIVYEVPLPPMHWYRWPSSRSRLITNGCHWIDHFHFGQRRLLHYGDDLSRQRTDRATRLCRTPRKWQDRAHRE